MKDLEIRKASFALEQREEKAIPQSRPDSGTTGIDLHKSRRRHVLVVEDDPSLSSFLGMELEADHFVVDLIHDGAEALEALQAKRLYDLLILDLNLPSLDGLSLLKKLRPAQS